MAAYDSDSSLDDAEDYTETNTLLGYASEEATDDAFSQIGGYPTWLDESLPASANLARCKVCNDMTALLLQLNGDLPKLFPGHERRLYLFSCRRKACRRRPGSVRGLRATRITKSAKPVPQKQEEPSSAPSQKPSQPLQLGTQLFGGSGSATSSGLFGGSSLSGSSNPFSSPISNDQSTSPAGTAVGGNSANGADRLNGLSETYAAKLSLGDTTAHEQPTEPFEPWPETSGLPRPYTRRFLDADFETLSVDEDMDSAPKPNIAEVEDEAGASTSGASGGGDEKDLFESSMDKTFQRFADRIRHNPEQVLRYEFDGSPLLYSSTDEVGWRLSANHHNTDSIKVPTSGGRGMPPCSQCGSRRKFELQLTPHVIEILEEGESMSDMIDGMDWGTIIFGVCEKDCLVQGTKDGIVGYVEEWIGVQWEELGGGGSVAK